MRRIFASLIVVLTLLALAACSSGQGSASSASSGDSPAAWPAMNALQSLSAADITMVEYFRLTEGGISVGQANDASTIENIYLRLKDVSVKGESKMGVDDDGLEIKIAAGDKTLHFSFEGDILVLEDGSRYEVDKLQSLRSYVDSLAEENVAANDANSNEMSDNSTSSSASNASGGNGTSTSSSTGASGASGNSGTASGGTDGAGPYDVSEGFETVAPGDGIAYLYFNDFMLLMPDNEKYSFDMGGDSVTFYLFSAQQEGDGGRLVTIKAFDMDDTSYEDLPMEFHVAGVGQNVNKRFVAIYPSDLQYDPQDSAQAADYKDLYDHLHKIGEGAANSPLQTSDSYSAPGS